MRSGSKALGCTLLWTGLSAGLLIAGCSDGDDGDTATTTTAPTTTTQPGPTLDTTTDDVEAAMRSLIAFTHWAEREPIEALEGLDLWLVPGGPHFENVEGALNAQADRNLVATGSSEILEVQVESQDDVSATVLVWKRSDAYEFVGPDETLESPAFERTLFVYELQRDFGGAWRIFDRRISVPQ